MTAAALSLLALCLFSLGTRIPKCCLLRMSAMPDGQDCYSAGGGGRPGNLVPVDGLVQADDDHRAGGVTEAGLRHSAEDDVSERSPSVYTEHQERRVLRPFQQHGCGTPTQAESLHLRLSGHLEQGCLHLVFEHDRRSGVQFVWCAESE